MDNILSNILVNQRFTSFLSPYLTIEDRKELLTIASNIQKKYLYYSSFHGIHHSEKVLLNAYIIGKHEQLNQVDMQILIDAAIYHDMGRQEDAEDNVHGYISSLKIAKVVDSPIYQDTNNVKLLSAICDGHSREDRHSKITFDNHEIEESQYERYQKLYSILKDADALDRTRFAKTSGVVLKESFLRIPFSKTLVEFSSNINHIYRQIIDELIYDSFDNDYNSAPYHQLCYHGIGFDFFKFQSILQHGILSEHALREKHIETLRNFNGNNNQLWISVVADEWKGKAYNLFIKNGISFVSLVHKFHEGSASKCFALGKGLPTKTNLYDDEVFVFDKIPRENIIQIMIPKEMMKQEIQTLSFFSCSLNTDILLTQINHFLTELKNRCNYNPDTSMISKIIFSMQNEAINFEKLSISEQQESYQAYFQRQDEFGKQINREVQKWMKEALSIVFSKDTVTLEEVIMTILKKENQTYDLQEQEDFVIFHLHPFEKENKECKTYQLS